MTADSTATAVAAPPIRGRTMGPDRIAGIGGLVFVLMIVVQNLIRSSAPSFGASPATVTSYFADHRTAVLVPLALFPVGMVALLCFTSGICARTQDPATRFWARVGALAVAVIAGLFAIVNMVEIAIAAEGDAMTAPQVVRALWAVHAAAFALNLTAIALALTGLSRVALAAGLLPRLLGPVALVGALCLFITAVSAVAVTEGSGVLYLGFLGFAVWGIFLVVSSLALVRARPLVTPSAA